MKSYSPNLPVEFLRQREIIGNRVRLGLQGFILVWFQFPATQRELAVSHTVAHLLWLVPVGYTALCELLIRTVYRPIYTRLFVMVDTLLVVMAVSLSGGLNSSLWPLLIFTILATGRLWGYRGTIGGVALVIPALAGVTALFYRMDPAEYLRKLWEVAILLSAMAVFFGKEAQELVRHNELARVQAQRLAAAEERNRLAEYLHNSFLSALAVISVRLGELELAAGSRNRVLKLISQLRCLIDGTVADARQAIAQMASAAEQQERIPQAPDDLGSLVDLEAVKGQIATVVREFQETRQCPVRLAWLATGGRLAALCAIEWVGVLKEALRNAAKHANARSVEVKIHQDDDVLTMTVVDDGNGFDATQLDQFRQSGKLGLAAMTQFARRWAGSTEITSTPGVGTRIRISIPVCTGERSGQP